jgi:hypothetical protein
MRFTISYGPTLISIIFDPEDEDTVLKVLQTGFQEARAAKEHGHIHNGDEHVHPD